MSELKICIKCNKYFSKSYKYCSQDGTKLITEKEFYKNKKIKNGIIR